MKKPETGDTTLFRHIAELSGKIYPDMVKDRRHLHRYPELSFAEYETTRYIKEKLTGLGYAIHSPTPTGCVAVMEGGIASSKVTALRADIDALPILEDGDAKKDFISLKPGISHCCGHDLHTANLLGTAAILSANKERIPGRVVLVFQPGEEKLPGGASLICESGILEDLGVQQIYGLHTDPNGEPGKIGIRHGRLMAKPDEFSVKIKGMGGHAASPHTCIDPVVIISQIVIQLQTIVSRNVNPADSAVVTVGKIEAGTAHNIIPAEGSLFGTVRTFRTETADLIRRRLAEIATCTAQSYGAVAEFHYESGYPAVMNYPEQTDNVIGIAASLFGPESVVVMDEPYMAGEDFSYYLQKFKGAFFFLGSGSQAADSQFAWHHPKYNVDEKCLLTGSALMASLVLVEGDYGKSE
ncbi:MAG: amidohydrolase [Balneolaceae bacterium]|nr:MAG: amidohydrolase [Balneolaceae bacterium]